MAAGELVDRRAVVARAGCPRGSTPCRGLSLVELLVAIAIGVALSFGAMNLLLHSKRSYLEAEELARLQENGRSALRYLSYELTMAGYLATRLPGTPVPTVESGTGCFDYLMQTDTPLEQLDDVTAAGEPGGGGPGLPADCLLPGRHVAGTDLLLTRRTLSAPTAAGGESFAAVDADAIYLQAAAGYQAARLQRGGGGISPLGELWEYAPQVLFLRNYSVTSGDGVPALCRKRLGRSSNRMAPTECLVEGIENLQLEFGIDENGDRQPDRFEPAPDPARLRAAVAARVYLLVRSVHPLAGHSDDNVLHPRRHPGGSRPGRLLPPAAAGHGIVAQPGRFPLMKGAPPAAAQRGVVLLVSLLVLLVLAIIATTVARTNVLELHMAGNEEARVAALQQALAAADGVLASAVGAPLKGGVGYRLCLPGSADPACDEHSLVLEPGAGPTAGSAEVAVTRVAPLADRMPVMAEARASSTVYYRVAKFEVQVVYDGTARDLGRAAIAQGLLVRLPSSPRSGGGTP